jgi:tRNA A37 threonylcarbamoyladenosine dehydratase
MKDEKTNTIQKIEKLVKVYSGYSITSKTNSYIYIHSIDKMITSNFIKLFTDNNFDFVIDFSINKLAVRIDD